MSTPEDPELVEVGMAGASARREHQRRHANREQRVRDKHPRIGGVLLALSDDPTHETVWARGAGGEERLAVLLAKRLDAGIVVLHDRRIPRSRANIDHIAIGPSGVWVIDTKRYKGKVTIAKPLLGKAKLLIAGRDKTTLIDGLAKQTQLARAAMADIAPGVPVYGALCFVAGELPMLGTLTFNGYPLLHPKALAKRINASGQLTAHDVPAIARELAVRFPVA